jgi:hypothetical protein
MRFRALLKDRVLHYGPEMACKIINASTVLHNMCIMGNVPEPVEEVGDESLDFGVMDARGVNPDPADRVTPELEAGRRARMNVVRGLLR